MIRTIKNSEFYGFISTDGGVFCIYSGSLSVECCSFKKNNATNYGGCIYSENSDIKISTTTFLECNSIANKNGIQGNVLKATGKTLTVNLVSTYYCGIDKTIASDSSIFSHNSKNIVEDLNATRNAGVHGGSSVSFSSCKDGTYIKYVYESEGSDRFALEAHVTKYCSYSCNFVNCSTHDFVYYGSANDLMDFYNCVFWNTGGITISVGPTISLYNCISDSTYNGVTKANTYTMNPIKNNYICKKSFVKCKRNDSFTLISLIGALFLS